ncbi:hypothetical protein MSG28_015917 [Choristoneura fumiferana]|uniref:Uncharacterized protein n=1 Tax=Choristoneura fumiferana TaxID=7141 RepID=A0ACC0K4R8_CHOFU|nr:hypothetical protein MSG28_015917 [Choristoneura fumiferana]
MFSDAEPDSKPLVIGLNTGEGGKKSEGVDKLIQVVKNVVGKMNTGPLFRSKKFDFDESEKNRGKSSVGIELDTPTLLNFVKKVISSRKFKKATDEFARKAGVIFRALKDSN